MRNQKVTFQTSFKLNCSFHIAGADKRGNSARV